VGVNTYCVNPDCNSFLVGLAFNSRTIDLENFLKQGKKSIVPPKVEVISYVERVIKDRAEGRYTNTANGWIGVDGYETAKVILDGGE